MLDAATGDEVLRGAVGENEMVVLFHRMGIGSPAPAMPSKSGPCRRRVKPSWAICAGLATFVTALVVGRFRTASQPETSPDLRAS